MPEVEIVIIGHGKVAPECAKGVTFADQTRWLMQAMTLAYGDRVSVRFIDIEEKKEDPLVRRVKEEGRGLPLLLVNGKIKFEGGIPLLALKALLDQIGVKPLEIKE